MPHPLDRQLDRRTLLRASLVAGAAGVVASSCSTLAPSSPGASTTTLPPSSDLDPFVARWNQFNVPCVWNRSVTSLASDPVATFRWRAAMGTAPLAANLESGAGDSARGIPVDRFQPGTRADRLFASQSLLSDGSYSAWLPKPHVWETYTVDRHWSGTDGEHLWEAVSVHEPDVAYQPDSAPQVGPTDPFFFLRKWYHYVTHRPVMWNLDNPLRNPGVAGIGDVKPRPSAMASGLPIMPLLADPAHLSDPDVDPDLGLGHALMITVPGSRIASERPAWPATYTDGLSTSQDSVLMGWRVRLSPAVDADSFPPQAAVIVRTLQRYGAYICMSSIPAEPGDSLFRASIIATPSKNAGTTASWDIYDVRTLGALTCDQFDVMDEDAFQTDSASFAA